MNLGVYWVGLGTRLGDNVGASMKLPVIATVSDAYRFVWRDRKSFWALALPGIAILAISTAVFSWSSWLVSGSPDSLEQYMDSTNLWSESGLPAWFYVIWLVSMVIYLAVLVMYSVAWHRRYLVPGEGLSVWAAYRWHMRQTRFFLIYVKIVLLFIPLLFLLVIVLGLIGGATAAIVYSLGVHPDSANAAAIGFAIQIPLWMIIGWFFARVSMLFPATAIDNQMSVRKGWKFSRKNGWRLYWIIVFVAIPVWVISWPFSLVFSYSGLESGLYGSLTALVLWGFVTQFLAFIGIAVGVSALSISYKRLVEAEGGAIQ